MVGLSKKLMIRRFLFIITLKIPIETHHMHVPLTLILAFKVKAFCSPRPLSKASHRVPRSEAGRENGCRWGI